MANRRAEISKKVRAGVTKKDKEGERGSLGFSSTVLFPAKRVGIYSHVVKYPSSVQYVQSRRVVITMKGGPRTVRNTSTNRHANGVGRVKRVLPRRWHFVLWRILVLPSPAFLIEQS